MEIVLTVTPETALRLRQGDVTADEDSQHLSDIVQSLGVKIVPMHRNIRGRDDGLSTFFVIEGAKPAQADSIAATLREIKTVTSAYTKPDAIPASGLVLTRASHRGFSSR